MESADAHRDAGRTQWACDIDRPRILIGLHANQADQPAATCIANLLDDARWLDAGVGLIPYRNPDFHICTQHLTLRTVLREAVQRCKCIRGNGRARPLNHVTVIVVMRGLDEEEMKNL